MRWANLNSFIRLLCVLAVLSVVGLFTAKPAYRAFKQWRMDQNLIAAQLAVDETRMQKARDLSLTVLRSGDLNIQAFRILEKSAAALGDPRHGEIARALISHPDGTDADRLTGFLTVASTMPMGLVGQAWIALPAENRIQPSFATAFAERLLAEKHFSEAAQVLLSVQKDAQNSDVQQSLARTFIASGKREGFEEAQRMIARGLTSTVESEVSGWLDVLETLPISAIQESLLSPARSLPKNVTKENPARVALILARMDYAAALPDATSVLDQTIATWKDQNPLLLAQFLLDLEMPHILLQTYPVDGLHNYPKLLPLLLDATQKTEAWEDAKRLLDSNDRHIPEYLALALKAVAAIKLKDANTGNEIWRAAIDKAKTDDENRALLKLYHVAVNASIDDFATSAMLNALRVGRGPLPLHQDQKGLCRALSETKQDTILLEVYAIYLNFEPSNPVLLTQYAYLACLNDVIEPDRLLPPLLSLAQAFPTELPIHTTLATVYLLTNQPILASEVLAPFNLENQEMAPPFRIVFLTSQVLMGKIPANDPQIENFPWNTLLASEQKKFSLLIRNTR